MKQSVIQLVLLLLAGAIVNVAVSCGLTLSLSGWKEAASVTEIRRIREARWPEPEGPSRFAAGACWSLTTASDLSSHVLDIGLPVLSMQANTEATQGGAQIVKTCLTLHPVWPGFAINTIFYAVILWVLFFVPGKVKRTLRRRRGLCPACAYPIGTSEVCTECGKQLA